MRKAPNNLAIRWFCFSSFLVANKFLSYYSSHSQSQCLQKKIKIVGVVSDNGRDVKNSTLLIEKLVFFKMVAFTNIGLSFHWNFKFLNTYGLIFDRNQLHWITGWWAKHIDDLWWVEVDQLCATLIDVNSSQTQQFLLQRTQRWAMVYDVWRHQKRLFNWINWILWGVCIWFHKMTSHFAYSNVLIIHVSFANKYSKTKVINVYLYYNRIIWELNNMRLFSIFTNVMW